MGQYALHLRWVAAWLLGVYFISLWAAPIVPIPALGWESMVVLAVGAYLLQGRGLNLKASAPLWVVLGIGFVGATISLLRAPEFDQALWNTVALGINIGCMMLFMTTFASPYARNVLLFLLISNGFLWTLEIQSLVKAYGTLAYSTFQETGSNKNAIGFFLAIGAVSLLYLCVAFTPQRNWSFWKSFLLRAFFALASAWFFFNICSDLFSGAQA